MTEYKSQLLPGPISADYELVDLIDVGGTSEVWNVHHCRHSGAYVAKILRHDMLTLAPRVQREFEVLTEFRHQGVIRSHDLAVTRDGRPFVVLDALPGNTLKDMLTVRKRLPRRQRAMSASRCWELFENVLAALERMEVEGVVHRDIKPGNLALKDGKLVLIDFGLARLCHRPGMTSCTTRIFTPGYASPEQELALMAADHRSDCQALCKILIECLAGYRWKNFRLLGGLSNIAQVSRVLAGGPLVTGGKPSVHDGVVVPLRLRMVLFRALARNADGRPSISEVTAALREAASLDVASEGATRLAGNRPARADAKNIKGHSQPDSEPVRPRKHYLRLLASTAVGAAAGAMLMRLIL